MTPPSPIPADWQTIYTRSLEGLLMSIAEKMDRAEHGGSAYRDGMVKELELMAKEARMRAGKKT